MKRQLRINKVFRKGQLWTVTLAVTAVALAAALAPAGVAHANTWEASTTIYSADITRIGVGLYESKKLTTPLSRSVYECNSRYSNIYIDRGSINGYQSATSQAHFRVKYYPTNDAPFRDSLGWEFITRHNTAPDHVIGTCVIPGTRFSIETDRRMDSYRVHY
jgi:hypothetical protein